MLNSELIDKYRDFTVAARKLVRFIRDNTRSDQKAFHDTSLEQEDQWEFHSFFEYYVICASEVLNHGNARKMIHIIHRLLEDKYIADYNPQNVDGLVPLVMAAVPRGGYDASYLDNRDEVDKLLNMRVNREEDLDPYITMVLLQT